MLTHRRREPAFDVYNLVFAIFLFLGPWLFAFKHGAMSVDAWVSSALIGTISVASLLAFSEWLEWLALATGLWILISPWVLGFPHTAAMRLDVAVGIVVTYLASLGLWIIHYMPPSSADSRS